MVEAEEPKAIPEHEHVSPEVLYELLQCCDLYFIELFLRYEFVKVVVLHRLGQLFLDLKLYLLLHLRFHILFHLLF